jgi:hypothetical protein
MDTLGTNFNTTPKLQVGRGGTYKVLCDGNTINFFAEEAPRDSAEV